MFRVSQYCAVGSLGQAVGLGKGFIEFVKLSLSMGETRPVLFDAVSCLAGCLSLATGS